MPSHGRRRKTRYKTKRGGITVTTDGKRKERFEDGNGEESASRWKSAGDGDKKQGSPLLRRRAIAEVVHLVERQGAMLPTLQTRTKDAGRAPVNDFSYTMILHRNR